MPLVAVGGDLVEAPPDVVVVARLDPLAQVVALVDDPPGLRQGQPVIDTGPDDAGRVHGAVGVFVRVVGLSAGLERGLDGAPNLPSGYGSMIVLTYFPPLWRKVMDHRVLEHYDGDITRVNLHPRRRAKIRARYGVAA